jgi:hypothetical protein
MNEKEKWNIRIWQRKIAKSDMLCCDICGGEPAVCAEIGNHDWVMCLECGSDARPSWSKCSVCDTPLDITLIRQNKDT